MERSDYRVGVPRKKQYKLVLNSDDVQYGGKGEKRPLIYKAEKQECDGRPYSFAYPLPPYGVAAVSYTHLSYVGEISKNWKILEKEAYTIGQFSRNNKSIC